MPYPKIAPPPVQPIQPTQPVDDVGTFRRLLAGAVRSGTGILGSGFSVEPGIGTAIGAGIGAGGEALAELVGKEPFNPTRMALEGGLTAVPLGKIFQSGEKLASMGRSAAFSGGGEALREKARGEDLSPTNIGMSTGLGGLMGLIGGLGGRSASEGEPPPPAAPAPNLDLDHTLASGGRRGTSRMTSVKNTWTAPAPITPSAPSSDVVEGGGIAELKKWLTPADLEREGFNSSQADQILALQDQQVARGAGEHTPFGVPYTPTGSVQRAMKNEAGPTTIDPAFNAHIKASEMQAREAAAAAKLAQKAADQEAASRAIEEAKAGLERQEPSVSQSLGARVPGGTERVTTRWVKSPDEGTLPVDDGLLRTLGLGGEGGAGGGNVPPNRPASTPQAPPEFGSQFNGPEDVEGLRRMFAGETPASGSSLASREWGTFKQTPGAGPAIQPFTSSLGEQAPQPATIEGFRSGQNPNWSPNVFSTESGAPGEIFEPGGAPVSSVEPPLPPTTPEGTSGPVGGRTKTPGQQAREDSYQQLLAKLRGESGGTPSNVAPEPTVPPSPTSPVEPPVAEAENPLANMLNGGQPFKTKVDATGSWYGDIKAAKAAGEPVPEAGRAAAGKAAGRERVEAGLAAPVRIKMDGPRVWEAGPASPQASSTPPTSPTQPVDFAASLKDLNQKMTQVADEKGIPFETMSRATDKMTLEQGHNFIDGLMDMGPKGGESGQIDPRLLHTLGLGLTGAAVGGATDPLHNRAKSALLGAGMGALAPNMPDILRSLGTVPESLGNLGERLKTPEGVREVAGQVLAKLPQWQRFNLLFSPTGLPANALVAPYGSALIGAIEQGLGGNPDGWSLLKTLTPQAFMKQYLSKQNYEEAIRLIGSSLDRSEGALLGDVTTPLERGMAFPGTVMTMGDTAGRDLMEASGFPEEMARRYTNTKEPVTSIGKGITGFAKRGNDVTRPMAQAMLPFSRTVANIGEEGAMRLPGLGSMIQNGMGPFKGMEHPDSARMQLIQQAVMSPAVFGLSALAGANTDPETRRMAQKFGTNAAGVYGLQSMLGFGMGGAYRDSKPILAGGVRQGMSEFPLPSARPITDLVDFLSGNGHIPSGVLPQGIIDEISPPTNIPSGVPSFKSKWVK